MTDRPDITQALAPGETLLWQGHPKPGRPVSARANLIALICLVLMAVLLACAWWLELFYGHVPFWHYTVYTLVTVAALLTFAGLQITLLDRRRARARDAATAYAITDRRVLALSGPYTAEIALGAEVSAKLRGGGIDVQGPDGKIRFDRLKEAKAVHAVLSKALGAAS